MERNTKLIAFYRRIVTWTLLYGIACAAAFDMVAHG
jgi:hypothetical protein